MAITDHTTTIPQLKYDRLFSIIANEAWALLKLTREDTNVELGEIEPFVQKIGYLADVGQKLSIGAEAIGDANFWFLGINKSEMDAAQKEVPNG